MSEDVCRLCSKCDVSLIDVFDNELDTDLSNKINICFGIQITKNDKITKKVCKQCYFLINSYSELRNNAINNDTRLKREYEEKKNKEKIKSSHPNILKTETKQLLKSKQEESDEELQTPFVTENQIISPPNTPDKTAADINQDSFLNSLKLTNVRQNSIPKPFSKKHLRYHPTVSRMKMKYPSLNLPHDCHQWNISPFIKVDKSFADNYKSVQCSENTSNNDINPKRPKFNSFSMDSIGSDTEFNLFELDHEEEQHFSDVSFCPSNAESESEIEDTPQNESLPKIINTRMRTQGVKRTESSLSDIEDTPARRTRQKLAKINVQNTEQSTPVDQSEKEKLHFLAELIEHDNCLDKSKENIPTADDLGLLVETTHVIQTFICQTCSRVFDSQRSLRDHQKQHLKSSLRCFKCLKSFPMVEDLINHNLEVHSIRLKKVGDKTKENEETIRKETENSSTTSNPPDEATLIAKAFQKYQKPILLKRTARKSTCPVKKDPPTAASTVVSNETKSKPASEKIEEYVISSDDEVEFISCKSKNTVLKTIENGLVHDATVDNNSRTSTDSLLKNNLTKRRQNFTNALKNCFPNNNDQSILQSALSIPKNTNDNNSNTVEFISEAPKTSNDLTTKITAVKIADEEVYLKYIFNRAKKENSKPVGPPLIANTNTIWVLRNMDKLLERSFVPVEFVPKHDNIGITLRYIFTPTKKIKPKSTTYRWCVMNAIDIPKQSVPKVTTGYANSVLTQSGQIYDISKNMEIVSVSTKPNEVTNSHSLIIKPTNSSHYIIPALDAFRIGTTKENDEKPQEEPLLNSSRQSNKSVPLKTGVAPEVEQFVAKVLPNGVLEITPTITTVPPKNLNISQQESMPLLHKRLSNVPFQDMFKNQAIILKRNDTPPIPNDQMALMCQQFGQQTNVSIQNILSINVPPRITTPITTNIISSSSVVNNNVTTASNTTKPLLRLKSLSELTNQPSESTINDRFTLQNMYVQTLTNYVNSCSNSPLNSGQNNADEYLQIT